MAHESWLLLLFVLSLVYLLLTPTGYYRSPGSLSFPKVVQMPGNMVLQVHMLFWHWQWCLFQLGPCAVHQVLFGGRLVFGGWQLLFRWRIMFLCHQNTLPNFFFIFFPRLCSFRLFKVSNKRMDHEGAFFVNSAHKQLTKQEHRFFIDALSAHPMKLYYSLIDDANLITHAWGLVGA